MSTEKDLFTKTSTAIVERYVDYFPEEAERQSPLLEALHNPDLDLRSRKTIPEGHICSSGILIVPGANESDTDRVLMLWHNALQIWVLPGGHFDDTDKDIFKTAIRESREETGIPDDITLEIHPWHTENNIPIDIDTHPIPARPVKNEGEHQHFDFRYVLTTPNPSSLIESMSLAEGEVSTYSLVPIHDLDPSSSSYRAIDKLARLGIVAAYKS